MEMKKLTDEDLKPREITPHKNPKPTVWRGAWVEPVNPIKLTDFKVTVSTLEKMRHDLDSKSVIMGSMNFVTARLTGYKWFKDKIKVKEDQSLYGRLVELIKLLISKLKGLLKITGVAEIPVDDNAAWMGVGISVIQVILRLVTKSEIVIK
jgi:hypothetical protein